MQVCNLCCPKTGLKSILPKGNARVCKPDCSCSRYKEARGEHLSPAVTDVQSAVQRSFVFASQTAAAQDARRLTVSTPAIADVQITTQRSLTYDEEIIAYLFVIIPKHIDDGGCHLCSPRDIKTSMYTQAQTDMMYWSSQAQGEFGIAISFCFLGGTMIPDRGTYIVKC